MRNSYGYKPPEEQQQEDAKVEEIEEEKKAESDDDYNEDSDDNEDLDEAWLTVAGYEYIQVQTPLALQHLTDVFR